MPHRCQIIPLLSCVAVAVFSLFAGCESSEKASRVESQGDDADPPVVQPQGSGTVSVTFSGLSDDQTATIYRIEANHKLEIEPLVCSDLHSPKELESGFYLVEIDGSHCQFPVPALAPFFSTDAIRDGKPALDVSLKTYPQSEDNWSWIPAGPTILGDTLGVGREDERPVRISNIKGFWMAQKEVTNEEYASFLNAQVANENTVPDSWIDLESRKCRISHSDDGTCTSDAPQLPVVMVSLAGARAYCQWRSKVTGTVHRLPKESEWEKAARGPEMFVYSYGNIYKQPAANQESGKLKPVGSYPPNSWGLYDMTGNVFEWMTDIADPRKKDTTLNHSLRGGSFVLDGMYLRNSFRMRQSPGVMTDDIGFRVVREATE